MLDGGVMDRSSLEEDEPEEGREVSPEVHFVWDTQTMIRFTEAFIFPHVSSISFSRD